MQYVTEAERRTPVYDDVDVLVCGGGVAGAAAAICAARGGARVLLLERYGYFGGLATGGLVITVPPLDNGICAEVRERLEIAHSYQVCPNAGEDDPAVEGLIALDPEILKQELSRMLQDAGVKLLLHSYVAESITEDGAVRGVIIENKGGRSALLAKIVIDATGDGDVAARAGAAFELDDEPLPITLMSNLIGVDAARAIERIGHWGNLRAVVAEAVADGELAFDLEIRSKNYAPGVFAAELCYPGEVNLWSGSLFGVSGIDPDELTMAEIVTREHTMRLAAFLTRHVPGFEHARIEYTAAQIGVRGTRRITGGESPSLREVLDGRFADAVVKPYASRKMRLPYGSLVPDGVDDLLCVGRCISAQPDAMVQLRLIPVCFATGQAAGTAAAMAAESGVSPAAVNVADLQGRLTRQGVALDLPKAVLGAS
jgi:glycine/D-amino acid oxidase-like deaminating enzyme